MYKLWLLLTGVVMLSCNNGKLNVANAKWVDLDSAKGISFCISETGKGEKGRMHVAYYSCFDSTFQKDTTKNYQLMYDGLIDSALRENKVWKDLPKGTSGYLKVMTDDFYRQLFADMDHYTIFFSPHATKDNLIKDSLQLAASGFFKKITITTPDEAIKKYTAENGNDSSWKNFVTDNPLPGSIGLTLKPGFLVKQKLDRVEDSLVKYYPHATIQSVFSGTLSVFFNTPKKAIIYKFEVI